MKVRIRGKRDEGDFEKAIENADKTEKIVIIGQKIHTIDLSEISQCDNLKKIILRGNNLTSIDLTPLQHCKNLEKIDLTGNKSLNVDLSPLTNCTSLREIRLSPKAHVRWDSWDIDRRRLPEGLRNHISLIKEGQKEYREKHYVKLEEPEFEGKVGEDVRILMKVKNQSNQQRQFKVQLNSSFPNQIEPKIVYDIDSKEIKTISHILGRVREGDIYTIKISLLDKNDKHIVSEEREVRVTKTKKGVFLEVIKVTASILVKVGRFAILP